MKRLLNVILPAVLAMALCFAVVGCTGNPVDPAEPTTYTVTYALNGGSGTLPTESAKEAGAKFNLATGDGLSKDNHTFDGWSDGTTKYAAGAEYTMPAKNVTFTAQWKGNAQVDPPEVTYTVTYDLDGGSGTLPTEDAKEAGAKFNLATGDGLSKDDHTFDGWSDGTTKYAAGAEYTMPAKNVTFTAQWRAVEKVAYSVTYDLDGAVTYDDNYELIPAVAPTEEDKYNGDKFELALAVAFMKEGKQFGGWSDGENVYPMGAEYTMPAKNITLTALWNDPLTFADIDGNWTNVDGDTLYVLNEDGDAVLGGLGLVNVDLDYGMVQFTEIVSDTQSIYRVWYVYKISSKIVLTELGEDENGNDFAASLGSMVFDRKVTNTAQLSDFVGKWKRDDNNQQWIVAEDGARYNSTLNAANAPYIIGDSVVLSYKAFGAMNIYVLIKDGDTLKGYYYTNEKAGVAVTFSAGNFVTLTVNGKLNQIVNIGSAPDASKLIAPTAPEGKEFSKWVITGTETEFVVTDAMNADMSIEAVYRDIVYVELVGELVHNGTTIAKFVINPNNPKDIQCYDSENVKVTAVFQSDNSNQTWKAETTGYAKADTYYFEFNIANKACSLLIKKDLTGLWVCDSNQDTCLANGEFLDANAPRPDPEENYTVTFDPSNDGATWTATVQAGEKVAKPAVDPVRENGKVFRYWSDDNGEYNFDSVVSGNLTLTAVYAWKVTFSAGEGTGTVEPIWVSNWTPGSIRSLPDGTELSCEGKVFDGWNDGTATYKAGDSYYENGLGNVTFTAVWKSSTTDPDNPDNPPVSGDKLSYFAGDSEANGVWYGAATLVDANGNTFATGSQINYKFNFYYGKFAGVSCFGIKRYYQTSSEGSTTVAFLDNAGDKISDANANNVLVYFKASGKTITMVFSVNNQGKRQVVITVTDNTSGATEATVTFVEISA